MSTDGMNVDGTTIYVCSGATLTWNAWVNDNNTKVIVLSGGKVIDTYGNVGKCCNADVYGSIEIKQDRIEINHTFRTSQNLNAVIHKGRWEVLPVFKLIQEKGNIAEHDMFNTYNMGVGMAVIVDGKDADRTIALMNEFGIKASVIGEMSEGDHSVVIE